MSEYRISDNVAVSESGFLFMANTGESFTVNELGRAILKQLKEGRNEDEIINWIVGEYDVDSDTARRDFDEFLTMLRNLNLMEEK